MSENEKKNNSNDNDAIPGADIARRWQALAERRRRHLIDLYRSGRWRLYYTEEQLMAHMRDAVRNIEEWSAVTGDKPAEADSSNPLAAVDPIDEAAE